MVSSTGADVVIAGGTVIDPAQELHTARDVVIADGKIAALTPPGAAPRAARVLDARGLLVTPGLIDLHTHVYLHVGRDNVDANSLAARSGTTTMVDAGSAGAAIFDGFRHYVAARARCRLLALLNISVIGTVASPMAQAICPPSQSKLVIMPSRTNRKSSVNHPITSSAGAMTSP